EDGIRDFHVTGVQTCALPIWVGLFLKATSSLIGPSEGVALRHTDRRNDHEIELAVVIGKAGSRISREDAWSHVAGYCIGLDMTRSEERRVGKECGAVVNACRS